MKSIVAVSALAGAAAAVALPASQRAAMPYVVKASTDACPADLNGDYVAPALIVPVDSANPNTADGTQYVASITPTEDSLFQFNIPSTFNGRTCSLILTLPSTANVQEFQGTGLLHTALLQDQVTTATTWNTKGPIETDHGNVTTQQGGSYVLATFNCPANYQLTYDLGSADQQTTLKWFETTQQPATGLWVRAC